MKRILLLLLTMPLCASVFSQIILQKPLSQRITGYDIDVVLSTEKHTVSGTVKAFWVNPSGLPVKEAMLHMYLNAFMSNKTNMATDGNWSSVGNDGYGWVRITKMTDGSGVDLTANMHYVQPDDTNRFDLTVMQVDLPEAVNPGDTLWLNMSFESKLPSPIRRTGFNKDYYFVGQWFPKFGVYETAGMRQQLTDGWNCHQFHPNSEFYSNHSVYNVTVTLPKEYITGSGGKLISEKDNGDSTKTIVWRAEDIVDFAWTAWPGYKVFTDKWRGTDITFLTSEARVEQVDRQIQSLKNALDYLDANVGPFPWPHVTFVDPPTVGSGAGGMEYTTIFTSASADQLPEEIRMAEMVTIHEFGHAYFMGILASNEFEEPWVDEGINSFWEQRIMDHYYGNGYGMISYPMIRASDAGLGRMQYIISGTRQVATNDLNSWSYPHGTYGMMSYQKTATWLFTLQGLIGEETMNNVFREYYKKWGFRHPSGRDFIDVVNYVVKRELGDKYGPDMNWYFDQVLYGSGICDYKVLDVSNKNISGFKGAIIEGDSVRYEKSDRKTDTLNLAGVRLERLGDITLPVDILIHFDNGDEVREQWDGKARFMDFRYTGSRKVEWAKIDPDNKITMDVNRINNSYRLERGFSAASRMMTKFISFIQLLISLITF